MRHYEGTHPWLEFKPDLDLGPATWMQLGEIHSKCEHVAGVPLHPAVQEHFHQVFLSKGAHATTRIEGNTLSEEAVRKRIQNELKLPPSQEYLGQEVDNVLEAYRMIRSDVAEGRSLELTPERIRELNRIVCKDLDNLAEDAVPGEFREHGVSVGNYVGAPAEDCVYLVEELCRWIKALEADAPPGFEFAVGVASAILAHLYLAWIHPFGDGNGRTARMVEFQLLAKARMPDVSAHLLSDHYNRTRTRYLSVLDKASKAKPYDTKPFIRYALQGLLDGLREQVEMIKAQQMIVTWQNFVHDRFRHESSAAARRRRHLVLTLPVGEITPTAEVRRLNPELAEQYAGHTQKMINRDLNALQDMRLVYRTRSGVQPAIDQMQAFMPLRAPESRRLSEK
ncbi:Fic family protein [Streptomyces sp. NPDC048623]|uniref:Fic family protein n=1 Tax=Streptomyces sp. NPDC048623 TaxID=3155761 RepID=UPI003434DFE3